MALRPSDTPERMTGCKPLLLFFSSSFTELQLTNKYYVYLGCTMSCFDIYTHCEMIATITLINICIISQLPFVCGDGGVAGESGKDI